MVQTTIYFLSSMPISELFLNFNGVQFNNKVYESALKLPYRDFMSVCFLVNKINLKNDTKLKTINDVVPDNWIYIQDKNVRLGRIQIFNNWSPYLFKNKKDIKESVLLSLEYFSSVGDEYWEMSDDDFIKFAIKEAEMINLFSSSDVVLSRRIKIEKAYPAYFDSYKNMGKIIKSLNKIENLFCIGRNGQHRYNNMDHSMMTGIEAINCILKNSKNKKERPLGRSFLFRFK